jgi:exopolysaccharide biosynthesis polyprenyl glycosylphosphotransferase
MLSRQHNFYQQFVQLTDALIIGSSLWFAHALRFYVLNDWTYWIENQIDPQFSNCYWMIVVAIPSGALALEYFGIYQPRQPSGALTADLWRIVRAMLVVLLVLFSCAIVLHVPQATISRTALALFFFLSTGLLFARAASYHWWLCQRGSRLHLRQHILLCGADADRLRWKERFLSVPGKNFEVKAEFDLRREGLARFVEMVHDESVDIVVFSLDENIIPQVREALLACEAEGVEAWVSADFIQSLFSRVQFDQFAGHPLLIYRTTPGLSWGLMTKRLIDIVGSSLCLLLASPLFLFLALAIRATSAGPVIFSQNRSGLHGRAFRMYKFRTMVSNAEQARAEIEALNEMSGPVFKLGNDPRITPFGRWLRKTSLDELPQLWNVLRGEMSLVGPRPLPLYETANFGDVGQRRRMSVRPGLTCLWQVSGRNQIRDFHDWVRLDLEYIDRWSLGLDLRILLRTVPVILSGWGAK